MITTDNVLTTVARSEGVSHALTAIQVLFEPGDVIEIRALDVGRNDRFAGTTHAMLKVCTSS